MVGVNESQSKKKSVIPLAADRYKMPDHGEGPQLIGNVCSVCGEVFFPKESLCGRCLSQELKETALSRVGILYSFTVIRQQPPVYKGPVPYAMGIIELQEGVRFMALLSVGDLSVLKIGMKMELTIEKLHEDAGNDVVCYKFKPVGV